MDRELEPQPAGAAAPLDQVKQSVYGDLQYVSLELDGKTYGGWYRQLPDGRLELLALANMLCERRPEGTPIEQARGMLAEFVRSTRRGGLTGQAEGPAESTLGDLLYADKARPRVQEDDWVRLVKAIAAGDGGALDQLFERTHRIVFTLVVRLLGKSDLAEELTVTVFQDVWRQAAHFDAAAGPVLAWLLAQARLRALERLELEQRGPSEVADIQRQAAVDAFWPNMMSCPSGSLREKLAQRIPAQPCTASASSAPPQWIEPEWEQAAPGISCKLLATDPEHDRVSMLVRLDPGVAYPPHRHAGREELHLLEGELWIEDRKLYPGDYNRAEAGSADQRVWSETGCACVLITSTRDVLAADTGS